MRKGIALILVCIIALYCVPQVSVAQSSGNIQQVNAGVVVNGQSISLERQPVSVNGRILVPARTVLEKLGARVEWHSNTGLIRIVKDNRVINMKIGDSSMQVNGVIVKMDAEPVLVNGTVMVPVRFAAEALEAVVEWDGANRLVKITIGAQGTGISRGNDRKQFVVVIDAGHGGKDPGAVYGGIREKDLNLDMAKRLEALLKAEGIKTHMTRTNDTFIALQSRAALANRVNADLFVSIHNNASPNTATAGSMTLYNPGTANTKGKLTAKRFADIVQREMVKELGTKNLGVIQRPSLAVLRTTNMPAVIAEIGYMSNRTELSKLTTNSYKQKAAESLKKAVLAALEEV